MAFSWSCFIIWTSKFYFNTETGVDNIVREPDAAEEMQEADLVSRILDCWPWGRGRREKVAEGSSETLSLRLIEREPLLL